MYLHDFFRENMRQEGGSKAPDNYCRREEQHCTYTAKVREQFFNCNKDPCEEYSDNGHNKHHYHAYHEKGKT